MKLPSFNVILAVDEKGGIAKNGTIPWNLKEDRLYFNKITTFNAFNNGKKNVLIMGRLTFESLPDSKRPLLDRINVIITSKKRIYFNEKNQEKEYNNVVCFSSFVEALYELSKWNHINEIFICGGSKIYYLALTEFRHQCNNVYVTHVNGDFQCDTNVPLEEIKKFPVDYYYKKVLEFEIICYKPNHEEEQYISLVRELRERSKIESIRPDRTAVGTSSVFVRTLKFTLFEGRIPLLTVKKVNFRHIVGELLWMLNANPDVKLLRNKDIHIWDGNTTREFLDKNHLQDLETDSIGLLYGVQMRAFGAPYLGKKSHIGYGIDQLSNVIKQIRDDPYSRRHIVSYYNPSIKLQCLYPCHLFFQLYVTDLPPTNEKKKRRGLSLSFLMRSTDVFLGLPYNQVFYSLLTCMIAHLCDMEPYEVIIIMNDCHLYSNHHEAADKLLSREPYMFPKFSFVNIENVKKIDDFKEEHFNLIDYKSHPFIKAEMAI